MALNFPASPTLNQTHSVGERTWRWNGVGWQYVSDPIVNPPILQPAYVINENVTLGANRHGLSLTSVEVGSGYSVEVPSGATWTIAVL